MKNIIYIIGFTMFSVGLNGKGYAQQTSLSLEDVFALARKGNRALQIQLLEEANSVIGTSEIRGRFKPNISLVASYFQFFDRQIIFMPGSFVGTNRSVEDVAVGGHNALNGFVSVNQPILAPDIRSQLAISKTNEERERERTKNLQSRIAYKISRDYMTILLMNEHVGLLKQSLYRNKKSLQDSRSLYFQGRALKMDTLRSFIAVESIRSALSNVENNIEIANNELKRFVGIESKDRLLFSDKLVLEKKDSMEFMLPPDEALHIALSRRHDLAIQEIEVTLQRRNLSAVKTELMPRLNLLGQYQVQAQTDRFQFNTFPRTSFLGLQFLMSIFDGNRTRYRVTQFKTRTEQEALRLIDMKDEVKMQLASIKSKMDEAFRQLRIQEATVASAELGYAIMDERFRNGRGSRLELTDSELALSQAKVNQLQAVYALKVLQIEWQHALGLLQL